MSTFNTVLKRLVDRYRRHDDKSGFSMLEAVVVAGVLLALAIVGFVAYGPITENAKMAKLEAAASEVYTASRVTILDGDPTTNPRIVDNDYNNSSTKIKVLTIPSEGGSPEDVCVLAIRIDNPDHVLRASKGDCSDGSESEPEPEPEPPVNPNPDPVEKTGHMIMTIDTTAPNCKDYSLHIWNKVNVDVDWGDNTGKQTVYRDTPTHSYSTDGRKTISIRGSFLNFGSASGTDQNCIISVDKWENTSTVDLSQAFAFTTQLTHVTEIPTTVENLGFAFNNSTSNPAIDGWNTINVTDMRHMFEYATSFNQPIGDWDTSNVTNMNYMFARASAFNQSISNWNVDKVTDNHWFSNDSGLTLEKLPKFK